MSSLFISNLFDAPQLYVTWVTVVMFSICLHEMAHAWTASWRGDQLARFTGFLTMNPLKTMGPFSLIMLLVFGIAWGAVPVNPDALRTRHNRALVSFAGPAANLALAILFAALLGVQLFLAGKLGDGALLEAGQLVTGVGAAANLFLFLFNMIPLPPFDGFGVLAAYWDGAAALRRGVGAAATLVVFVLIFSTPVGDWLFALAAGGSHLGAGLVQLLLTMLFGG